MNELHGKYTPGPWTVEGEDQFATVIGPDGYIIAETEHVHGDYETCELTHVANMRLISSAIDLLVALQGILGHYAELIESGDCGSWDVEEEPAVIAARKAIAKATGVTS